MVTEKIQELKELNEKAAKLAAVIENERTSELSALPSTYGYESVEDFIKAVRAAAGAPKKTRGRKKAAAATPAPKKKRTRAKITPELKEQVKAAVAAGQTGAEIAKAFGISLPSVQNIKKEAGLVKARS